VRFTQPYRSALSASKSGNWKLLEWLTEPVHDTHVLNPLPRSAANLLDVGEKQIELSATSLWGLTMIRKPLVTRSISELQRYIRPRIASSGHAHFWRRAAALSRRNFLQAGATLAAGLAIPPALCASREPSLPNPIPGGLDLLGTGQIFHVFLPGTSPELATITDFNGAMGASDVLGTWTAEGFTPPPDTPIIFDADVRFMSGEYIGRDTKHHQGAFAFV